MNTSLDIIRRCFIPLVITATQLAAATDLVIDNVTIIDVRNGTTLPGRTIEITDGRIVRLASTTDYVSTKATHSLDGRGMYAIPGLWDMHTHASGQRDFDTMVAYGVTGTRIMAGGSDHLQWKREIDSGKRLGPALIVCGPILYGPSFIEGGVQILRSPAQARAEVRRQQARGYDFIKVHHTLAPNVYLTLLDEALRLSIPVVGHVPAGLGALGAIEAGQQCIEHLDGYAENLLPKTAPIRPEIDVRSGALSWNYIDAERFEAVITATHENGVWNCPTLSGIVTYEDQQGIEAYLGSEGARLLPPERLATMLDRSHQPWFDNMTESDFLIAREGFANRYAFVGALRRAGGKILAGSDSDPWGFSLHFELEQLVKAGLTPQQALATATINPAEYAKTTSRYGVLKEGSVADLIILRANPLHDIRNTRQIEVVVVKGRVLHRDDLDALLSTARDSLKAP